MALCRHVVRRRGWAHSVELDDLLQVAMLGLMRARETWDPSRGAWATHATWWIRAKCDRYVADTASTVRTPVSAQLKRSKRGDRRRAAVLSLDAPVRDGEEGTWLDRLEAPEVEGEPQESLEALIERVPTLSAQERLVCLCRAGGGLLDDAARELGGLSRERARQIQVAAVKKIRAFLAEPPRSPVSED